MITLRIENFESEILQISDLGTGIIDFRSGDVAVLLISTGAFRNEFSTTKLKCCSRVPTWNSGKSNYKDRSFFSARCLEFTIDPLIRHR